MHYAIVGAGSVGKAVGAALALNGRSHCYIRRTVALCDGGKAPVGFRLQDSSGGAPFSWTPDFCCADGLAADGRFPDTIFLAVRAHQVGGALRSIRPLLKHARTLVFLQGGIQFSAVCDPRIIDRGLADLVDPEDYLSLCRFDAHRPVLCNALVSFGAESPDPGVVRMNGPGKITLGVSGAVSDVLAALAADLSSPWIEAIPSEAIMDEMFRKACGTLGLNAASLIWRCPLGSLVSENYAVQLMGDLADYAAKAYAVAGFNTDTDFQPYFRMLAARLPLHKMAILNGSQEIYATIAVQALLGERILGYKIPHADRLPFIDAAITAQSDNNQWKRQAIYG